MAIIICEIGQNHCGDMELAKRLIVLAKENGGDLAKFQLYDHYKLYKDHPEIPDVALSFEQAKMLFNYGQKIGIEVFFSVFDVERVEWCEEIGVKRYKLACRTRNPDIMSRIFFTHKPVIVSTQGSEYLYGKLGLEDVKYPTKKIWRSDSGCKVVADVKIKFIYCSPKYPSTLEDYDLLRYATFDSSTRGISDHTIGLDTAKIALARGASIIEKHFAIDHQTGVDAEWSMTPDELKELKRWETICPAKRFVKSNVAYLNI